MYFEKAEFTQSHTELGPAPAKTCLEDSPALLSSQASRRAEEVALGRRGADRAGEPGGKCPGGSTSGSPAPQKVREMGGAAGGRELRPGLEGGWFTVMSGYGMVVVTDGVMITT